MKRFIGFLLLVIIIGIPAYIYTSSSFERVPPKITTTQGEFWNLRDNFVINISDDSGIKYYKVVLINDGKAKTLQTGEFTPADIQKNIKIDIKLPEFYDIKGDSLIIKVEAIDNSKWNYFAGNEAKKEFKLKIDTIAPEAEIINNNYSMRRGGSGIAIVKVADKNLKEAYIKITERDNPKNFKILKLTPFYKKDYFISLLVWPYEYKTFSADLVAKDKAGNIAISHIPIRWLKVRYPKAKIKISDKFIQRVAIPLLQKVHLPIPNNPVDIFKEVNEKLRAINEKKLYDVTNVILDKEIKSFVIKPFKPLKRSAKQASFGEMRSYYYNGKKISFAIHKGLDIASYVHDNIYASNSGEVIFEGFNGIYGNTIAVYHKLGLVSTYSHCSSFKVNKGVKVSRGLVIAKTGDTGAVFGDHLHFGIYIQGLPVEPIEWMDAHWIRDNITKVIIKAKREIDR